MENNVSGLDFSGLIGLLIIAGIFGFGNGFGFGGNTGTALGLADIQASLYNQTQDANSRALASSIANVNDTVLTGKYDNALMMKDASQQLSNSIAGIGNLITSQTETILKAMNRRYNMDEFIAKIEEIRSIRPNIAITTDVIVGFPGETDELFNETVESIKKIGFTELHVFPYSKREGTPAAIMPNQVDGNIAKERVKTLINLSNELKNKYYSSLIGTDEYLLTETFINGYLYGHLTNYGFCKIKSDERDINCIFKVKLISYDGECYLSEVIK